MPRKVNPKSIENLKKAYGGKGGFNTETARIANRNSQEIKRALKTFRELDAENTTDAERLQMLSNLKTRAKHSNAAFELYRDTVGLKPKDNVDLSVEGHGVALDELEKMVLTDDTATGNSTADT